jgi:Zn-dependent protease
MAAKPPPRITIRTAIAEIVLPEKAWLSRPVKRRLIVPEDDKQQKKPPVNPYAGKWSAERPEDRQYDVREGEYLPPDGSEKKQNTAKGVGAGLVGIGLLLAKFKGLLYILFSLKWLFVSVKLLAYSWTFFLSLGIYVLFFGWKIAIVFILVLLTHELGHYFAFRNYGLEARLPVFIPLLGAFTAGTPPKDLEQDAYIALAGPLTGLVLGIACYAFGTITHDAFWYASAYICAFLNLFNMIPTPPFDGGRVINAIAPVLWIAGFILFIVLAIALHISLIFIVIIGLFGLPSVIAAFRGHVDPRAAAMTNWARARVGAWYLVVLFGLVFLTSYAHVAVPNGFR